MVLDIGDPVDTLGVASKLPFVPHACCPMDEELTHDLFVDAVTSKRSTGGVDILDTSYDHHML